MGLNVYQEERGIHELRIRNLYGDLQCLTDTIGQIADDYGILSSRIRRWNNLKRGSHIIYPGQKLTLWVKEG